MLCEINLTWWNTHLRKHSVRAPSSVPREEGFPHSGALGCLRPLKLGRRFPVNLSYVLSRVALVRRGFVLDFCLRAGFFVALWLRGGACLRAPLPADSASGKPLKRQARTRQQGNQRGCSINTWGTPKNSAKTRQTAKAVVSSAARAFPRTKNSIGRVCARVRLGTCCSL